MSITKLSEALADINTMIETLQHAQQEINDKLASMEAAMKFFDTDPQQVIDAFEALKTAVQAQEDIIPG